MHSIAESLALRSPYRSQSHSESLSSRGTPYLGTVLESWIVSTLVDQKEAATAQIAWKDRLDDFLKKRSADEPREKKPRKRQKPEGGWYHFHLKRGPNVYVVTLTDKSLLKLEDLAELEQDLAALIEASHRRLVINFAHVQRMTSWTGQSIVNLMAMCKGLRGATLRLCGITPDLARMFEITQLAGVLSLYPDEATAIESTWPELPEMNPLPIDVIQALCPRNVSRAIAAPPARVETVKSMKSRDLRRTEMSANDSTSLPVWKLVVDQGTQPGKAITVKKSKVIIGRDSTCKLRPKSAFVSRFHASIEQRDARLYLKDLGSTNGTQLNGRVLKSEEAELQDGDRVQIGAFGFNVEQDYAIANDDEGIRLADDVFGESKDAIPVNVEPELQTLDFNAQAQESGVVPPRVELIEDTLVVTPMSPELDSAANIELLRNCLIELMDRTSCLRWVLDLKHVGHMSGRSIGVVIAHYLNLAQVGGVLRICEANPRVAVVLEHIKIGQLVDCHETLDDAVLAPWETV